MPDVAILPCCGRELRAELRQASLGPLRLSVIDAFGQTIHKAARAAPAAGNAPYYLLQLHKGRFAVEAGDRLLCVEERECLLLDSQSSYRIEFAQEWRCRIVQLPADWLTVWLPDPQRCTLRPFSASRGWGCTLAHTVASLDPAELSELALPAQRVADLILGLIAQAATSGSLGAHRAGHA